jgi:Fe-S cluster assembly scaffold protein SufB
VLAHLQVPAGDNYYAALNCAVFSDGSFVYIPKGVKCPMELSTYFRINAQESGQVHSRHNLLRRLLRACMRATCP